MAWCLIKHRLCLHGMAQGNIQKAVTRQTTLSWYEGIKPYASYLLVTFDAATKYKNLDLANGGCDAPLAPYLGWHIETEWTFHASVTNLLCCPQPIWLGFPSSSMYPLVTHDLNTGVQVTGTWTNWTVLNYIQFNQPFNNNATPPSLLINLHFDFCIRCYTDFILFAVCTCYLAWM